ncbi:MAG: hypothetical protein KF861_16200 [Planctomycetaceae bacterium]|nr:hypothetical protein [Planctomycetaceae bacterium]
MKTQTSGTVDRGQVLLDEPVHLPDQTRVQVTIELKEDWRLRYRSGLDHFLKRIREKPIHAGVHFRREELHERH